MTARPAPRTSAEPEHGFPSDLSAQPVLAPADHAAAPWPGHSVIVVAVPPLENLVRWRTRTYDDAYLSIDRMFAHAHVTVLGPFIDAAGLTPSLLSTVGRVLRRHDPFTAVFTEVSRFPDGTIYLPPDDEEPFRRLTTDVVDAFPDHPPYGGRYVDPRPHVTLDRVGRGVDLGTVRSWVARLLPIRVEVRTLQLSWYEQHACRTLTTWQLG